MIPCATGKYSSMADAESSSVCQDCPPEEFSADAAVVCSSCDLEQMVDFSGGSSCITDGVGFFNKISNMNLGGSLGYDNPRQGNDIIASGDKLVLAVGRYYGAMYSRACDTIIYAVYNLGGRMECASTEVECILDGEGTRRIMWLRGTQGQDMVRRRSYNDNDNDNDALTV